MHILKIVSESFIRWLLTEYGRSTESFWRVFGRKIRKKRVRVRKKLLTDNENIIRIIADRKML